MSSEAREIQPPIAWGRTVLAALVAPVVHATVFCLLVLVVEALGALIHGTDLPEWISVRSRERAVRPVATAVGVTPGTCPA